jgi:dipeptidase
VPIYAGVQEISPLYKEYDISRFSENSARWAVDFVDNLLHLRWQSAVKDLSAARDPIENDFFDRQAEIEEKALKLYNQNPKKAKKYLTELTTSRMERIVQMYRELRNELISKYTNSVY